MALKINVAEARAQLNDGYNRRVSNGLASMMLDDIESSVEEVARLRGALQHVLYRTHEPSLGCDGCVSATALATTSTPEGEER